MSSERPPWTELEPLGDQDMVFRLVRPGDYVHDAPEGTRLQLSHMPTQRPPPSNRSYGPSVFAESKLANGLDDLQAAQPKWSTWGVAKIPVGELRRVQMEGVQVDVRFSPQDCEIPSVRHAHASLINVDRKARNALVRLIESYLIRPPDRPFV